MNQTRSKRKLPSIVRWILWVLLVQVVLVNISAALYAYKLTHFYTDPSLRDQKTSKNILAKTWKLFTGPRFARTVPGDTPQFPYDSVIFTTKKGLRIHAWYARPDSASRGTVIMFHGVTAQKSLMIPEAGAFRDLGLNVLMVDFRGHGGSEGNQTSLGVRETEDVKLAYDYIVKQGEKNIYLYGVSMGAVVIAKAVSDDEIKPAALIMEMPFASLKAHLQARARTLGFPGFPERPFGFLVSNWIGWETGFNGPGHQTTQYAKDIHCPVLLQWGEKDELVMRWEMDAVYGSISSKDKKLVTYPGAGHESLFRNDPGKWRSEVGSLMK